MLCHYSLRALFILSFPRLCTLFFWSFLFLLLAVYYDVLPPNSPYSIRFDYALNLLAYLYHLHCYHINIELSLANCDSDALIVGAQSESGVSLY